MYASRGGGGGGGGGCGGQPLCIQMRTRGEGGLNMTKNTHFVRRLIENAVISAQRKVNG